jgi:phage FluMu gp28-like protein
MPQNCCASSRAERNGSRRHERRPARLSWGSRWKSWKREWQRTNREERDGLGKLLTQRMTQEVCSRNTSFKWKEDASRFKAGLMSRQVGKDFSSECEAVESCLMQPTEWMVAAPSERQALDSLEQGKVWAASFDLAIADYQEERVGGSETLLKSAEVVFSNKSRIRAVPGKPSTVRGRSTNILLTEFDFFENPADTWRAILPSITNPLRGGEKKVRLITTPNGAGGAMHKIWTKEDGENMKWSRHLVTIYHAVLMGLPVNIKELKKPLMTRMDLRRSFCAISWTAATSCCLMTSFN